MKLIEIDHAIEVCNKHLTETNAFGTEIEAYLTRYLLIYISSCFEIEIKKIIIETIKVNSADKRLEKYLDKSFDRIFRSIQISNIKSILSYFGTNYSDYFTRKTSGNKELARACTYYNNLVFNRHNTAHSKGSNMTFIELKDSYEKAHIILDIIKESLSQI